MKELRQTWVNKGESIVINAAIVYSDTIGKYTFIGAVAVVTRDILPYVLMGREFRAKNWLDVSLRDKASGHDQPNMPGVR